MGQLRTANKRQKRQLIAAQRAKKSQNGVTTPTPPPARKPN